MQVNKALRIGALLGLTLTITAGSNLARAEFKDMLRLVPGEANALLVVDVEKVLKSPMAIREGWPQAQTDAYAAKPMVVPPGDRSGRARRPTRTGEFAINLGGLRTGA